MMQICLIILTVIIARSYQAFVSKKKHERIMEQLQHELDGVDGMCPHDTYRLSNARRIINSELDKWRG